jgi:DNA-binding MurR/RpiR family transcriptional regulator
LPIKNHIAAINERLTPTQRRIAEAVLEDQSLLTFGNVSELGSGNKMRQLLPFN